MTSNIRRVSGDIFLIAAAIVGALIAGLSYGPMLRAGVVLPLSWWPAILIASLVTGIVAWIRGRKRLCAVIVGWTFLGCCLSVLILCSVAGLGWPGFRLRDVPPAVAGNREPLAIMSALDLFWGQSRTLSALDQAFEIDRLDRLSKVTLNDHDRLLLAQPRMLSPEELVALDGWIREGGRAVVLADPLLLWPSDLAMGDRRRPPVTSLLDPLLHHWGLKLEPASSAVQRRFVGEGRLMTMAGASHFTLRHSDFARCQAYADGWAVTCRVGDGRVRLIADADVLDERVWRSGPWTVGDNIALLDRWLRQPMATALDWQNATIWVRGDRDLMRGLRYALLAGIIWAIMGGTGLYTFNKQLMPSRAVSDESRERT